MGIPQDGHLLDGRSNLIASRHAKILVSKKRSVEPSCNMIGIRTRFMAFTRSPVFTCHLIYFRLETTVD
jgi:hypothetical protein